MEKKQLAKTLMQIILAFSVAVMFLCYSINSVVFSEKIYEKNIESRMAEPEKSFYLNQTAYLLNYLKQAGPDEQIAGGIYSPREKEHMKEVRQIFVVIQKISSWSVILIAVFLLALYFSEKPEFKKSFFSAVSYSGYGMIAFCILLGILFINFSSAFVSFHLLFFNTDTWMLSPSDTLIVMFPEEFFMSAAYSIIGIFAFYGAILIAIGYFAKKAL